MKELHKPKLSANMVMVTDAKGNPSASANITNTELNMLNNIRTNVQNQIDAKVASDSSWGMPDYTAGMTYASDILYMTSQDYYLKWGVSIANGATGYLEINGEEFARVMAGKPTGIHPLNGLMIPIPKGTTVKGINVSMVILYPIKKEA